jgi:hypothetical protein
MNAAITASNHNVSCTFIDVLQHLCLKIADRPACVEFKLNPTLVQ